MQERRIVLIGTGSFAHAHAYALSNLHFYYRDAPKIVRVSVASPGVDRRREFADRYGFQSTCDIESVWSRNDFDTVFILGPNASHYGHLMNAISKKIPRIYIEKPLCVSAQEEDEIVKVSKNLPLGVSVQTGFQFLQVPALRQALQWWKSKGGNSDLTCATYTANMWILNIGKFGPTA